ncbi:MAG: hypothetical protein ACXABY_07795 [Candidatus Thorarchaeota archaeon]|jgi:hypothetical protein
MPGMIAPKRIHDALGAAVGKRVRITTLNNHAGPMEGTLAYSKDNDGTPWYGIEEPEGKYKNRKKHPSFWFRPHVCCSVKPAKTQESKDLNYESEIVVD